MANIAVRAQDGVAESSYPLISAYIYNFTQFTDWPAGTIKNSFAVCVLGKNSFGGALEPLKNRTVDGKPIAIRLYSHIEGGLNACNVLFVAGEEAENLPAVLAQLGKAPVLTMSNSEGFSDNGGMVEFRPQDGHIGIWINLPPVRNAGISISSKLLSLSHVSE